MLFGLFLPILVNAWTVRAAPYRDSGSNPHDRPGLARSASNPSIRSTHRSKSSHRVYSPNWSGAVVEGNQVTHVTGTFNVPSVRAPPGADPAGSYSGSVWIGIDGYKCKSAILQTGFDFSIQDGQVSYNPWYEWWPANSVYWDNISFREGDKVRITIAASSSTSGSVTIDNLSNQQSVSHHFENQNEGQLCQTDAEWIVEDWEMNGSLVSLADFGTITFDGAKATDQSGVKGVEGANLIDMTKSGHPKELVISTSTSGSGKIIIDHT